MPVAFRYNVYCGGVKIMDNASSKDIAERLKIDQSNIPHYASIGQLIKKKFYIERINGSDFYSKFGIHPEAYDRAMKDFLRRWKHE